MGGLHGAGDAETTASKLARTVNDRAAIVDDGVGVEEEKKNRMNGRKTIYKKNKRLTRLSEKGLGDEKQRCVNSAWENECNIKVKRRPGWGPFFVQDTGGQLGKVGSIY